MGDQTRCTDRGVRKLVATPLAQGECTVIIITLTHGLLRELRVHDAIERQESVVIDSNKDLISFDKGEMAVEATVLQFGTNAEALSFVGPLVVTKCYVAHAMASRTGDAGLLNGTVFLANQLDGHGL